MARDAIYCRYSSTNQDTGVSIELQLEICRKVAGPDPLIYTDRAVTGRTMQRAGFRQMLDAAERGEFTRLIVYKWDRFGRNAETHATIADLEDLGIAVTSATEGADFLARGVGLLVSEDYSRKLSERVRDSMRLRFKQQKCHLGGPLPYGYTTIRNNGLSRWAVDPAEAAIVQQVYQLYLRQSIGAKRISRLLNAEGKRARGGNPWGFTTVNNILHNRVYTGQVTYGKRREFIDRRSGKVRRQPGDPLTFQDEGLRIVSDADWARVHATLQTKNTRDYRTPKHVRPLSNVAYCAVCGTVMYCRHTSLQRPIVYRYLVCGRRDRLGVHACHNASRPTEDQVLALVQAGVRQTINRHRDQIIRRAITLAEKALDTHEQERGKLAEELEKIEAAISRFRRLLRDPQLTDAEVRGLLSQVGTMEGERDQLNVAMRKLAGAVRVDHKLITQEITGAMEEAEKSILRVTDHATLNRAILRFCGQMQVHEDGRLTAASTGIIVSPHADTGGAALRAAFWHYAGIRSWRVGKLAG